MSLDIKPAGYFAIVIVLLSVFLTYKISIRLKDTSILSKIFTWVLCLVVLSLSSGLTFQLYDTLHAHIAGKAYHARVLKYTSYEKEYKNSGDNHTRKSTLNVPIVQFKDKDGIVRILPSNLHSTNIPEQDVLVDILYVSGENSVHGVSVGTYLMVLVNIIFVVVLMFLTLLLTMYAYYATLQDCKRLLKVWGLKIVYTSLWLFLVVASYIRWL